MEWEEQVELYSVLKDVLRQWYVILLFALSAAMLAAVVCVRTYQPVYTTEATLYVTRRGVDSSIYENQYSAQSMSERFEQLLNSSVLQKKVAQEVGMEAFQGTASAKVIEETNLITLKVSAATPRLSFLLMQSILKNYGVVTDYMTGSAILEVLKAPQVATQPDVPLAKVKWMKKAFLLAAGAMIFLLSVCSWVKDTIRQEGDIEKKLDSKRLGTLWHERRHRGRKKICIADPAVSFCYVESIHKIAHRIKKRMDERSARTLLVTSVQKKEGKSVVAENLALALARESEQVWLIPAERGRMEEALRAHAKYVIMDSEALDDSVQTEEIAALADACVLVVQEHRTEAAELKEALELLNGSSRKNLGCIYNNAQVYFQGEQGGYGYRYGTYGGYGYGR